ncbi:MAG: succinate dehydrogenase, hydrophobic membrane anchor protein [Pseudomonadota bacterium]
MVGLSLRSPLGRVLGRGSAKEGTDHWWMQRVTSVALGALGLWFLFSMMVLPDFSQSTVAGWIGQPWNALMLLLLGISLTYHSSLGVQVVIEDYVHGAFLKVFSLLLNKFAHTVVAAAVSFAVLKIAFGTS